jgi:DUF4097 and DUF4098 domain-containing protein YvlB
MKKLLFSICLSMPALIMYGQFNSEKDPVITKSLTSESIKYVHAETSGGNISVSGGESSYRLEIYARPNRNAQSLSKEELLKKLDEDYNLEITTNNNKLVVIAKPKSSINWKTSLSISIKVFAPQNTATRLRTSGGNVALNNLTGEQDFATSGGNLNIETVTGKINGRTSGGNIHITGSKDDMDLSTSGGNIDAENCTGTLKLQTSGGSVELDNLKGNIKAVTSGGNVKGRTVEGELYASTSGGNVSLTDLSSSVEAKTSGGNITVEIKQLGKYVKLRNSAGNIDLQLPKSKGVDLDLHGDKINVSELSNFSGSKDDNSLVGKLNGGGIPINVDAGSGRIRVTWN